MSFHRRHHMGAEVIVCDVGKITRCIKFLILISSFLKSIHRKYRTVIGQKAVPKVMMQNVNDVLKPHVPFVQPYYVPLPK